VGVCVGVRVWVCVGVKRCGCGCGCGCGCKYGYEWRVCRCGGVHMCIYKLRSVRKCVSIRFMYVWLLMEMGQALSVAGWLVGLHGCV